MRRILVVANQTLGTERLHAAIRELAEGEPTRFHFVVPATRPKDHLTWTEGEAREIATRRLAEALDWARSSGMDADGEVGDARPVEAVGDALIGTACDMILVSTLPLGLSRWVRQDFVHRMDRRFDVPVVHVVATSDEPEQRAV